LVSAPPGLRLSAFVLRRQAPSTLFPYTTLFRSIGCNIRRIYILVTQVFEAFNGKQFDMVFGDAGHSLKNLSSFQCKGLFTMYSRSEEHTSELQSRENLVCRLLLEKKNKRRTAST